MSGYVTIPSHPRYAITREGDIKWIDNQAPVQPYMGRATVDEEPHLRVRLRNHLHYPIAHRVEDLLVETFPDYVRPEKPVEVEEQPKPKERKHVPERELKRIRKESNVYTRNNLPDQEFRKIPGFSRYEINKNGDLWSLERHKLIKVYTNPRGKQYFHVYADTGVKTSRNPQSLIDLAFPELAKPKREEWKQSKTLPVYRSKNDWRHIPGYPRYQAHPDGTIRIAGEKRTVKPKVNSISGESYINIQDADKVIWSVSVDVLIGMVFQNEVEEVAA